MRDNFTARVLLWFFIFTVLIIPSQAFDINIFWNTFLGSGNHDRGEAIATDDAGRIYVTGDSRSTWGSPIRQFSTGNTDAFIVCLDSDGKLLWNTFLGSSEPDYGKDIIAGNSGKIYVIGESWATWGSPVSDYEGELSEAFIACLDSKGNLLWNTFLGSDHLDYGNGITIDSSGNIYVIGYSARTWGSPVNEFIGYTDAFVACLRNDGKLLWNTFIGSRKHDYGNAIALDSSGIIYVTGNSDDTWGSPVRAFNPGKNDVFIACLNSNGYLLWNTFLGSPDWDYGFGIVVDSSGNCYIVGQSTTNWGLPVRAFSGSAQDVYVAGLDVNGNLLWNTFLGSADYDFGMDITLDGVENILVTGSSRSIWGSPIHKFNSGLETFIARLNNNGDLLWNTFFGSSRTDTGRGIVIDDFGSIYVTGKSLFSWGSPVNAFTGYNFTDTYVAKITMNFKITALVSGNNGKLSLENKILQNGENAVINIYPDPGYVIGMIIDNQIKMTLANPYVIYNVQEDHHVEVTFDKIEFPPSINLKVNRKTETSWIISKDYVEISITIAQHPIQPFPISEFILNRKEDGSWTQISTYKKAGSYTYIDRVFKKGEKYCYQVVALDSVGTIVASSDIVTIQE